MLEDWWQPNGFCPGSWILYFTWAEIEDSAKKQSDYGSGRPQRHSPRVSTARSMEHAMLARNGLPNSAFRESPRLAAHPIQPNRSHLRGRGSIDTPEGRIKFRSAVHLAQQFLESGGFFQEIPYEPIGERCLQFQRQFPLHKVARFLQTTNGRWDLFFPSLDPRIARI